MKPLTVAAFSPAFLTLSRAIDVFVFLAALETAAKCLFRTLALFASETTGPDVVSSGAATFRTFDVRKIGR